VEFNESGHTASYKGEKIKYFLAKFLVLRELGGFDLRVSAQNLESKGLMRKFLRNKGLRFWRCGINTGMGV
jgi:hypothetical protein